jgi:hypothetical protein
MESFEEFLLKIENRANSEKIARDSVASNNKQSDNVVLESAYTETFTEPTPVKKVEEVISGYKLYRDKPETFICDMEISGANPSNSKARVIIESRDMTYMFEGTIDGNGHCEIPLKKMNFLTENEIGKIKLEVIADDIVFNPWEDSFVAVNHRKVTVKIAESVDTAPKVGVRISNIR